MNKKKKTAVIAAFVVLGIAVAGLAVSVYAKYFSTLISGEGKASVAKWAFDTDNTNGTISCEPDDYDEDTLVDDKIAPGTSGKCTLIISNANSDVGVKYTIKPKTISDQPTNLKFYQDEAHTQEFSATSTISPEEPLAPGATARNVYIYWYWPYETGAVTNGKAAGDDDDTTNGKDAKDMKMTFEITGVQVRPE